MNISNLTRTERCKIFKDVQINNKNAYELLFFDILNKKNITFYYQRIISPYILDFYLPGYGLAIEIDGEIHNKRAVEIRDNCREAYITSFGIRVMRYNTSINKETPEQFIEYLLSNFPKISNSQRKKINTKINRIYRILNLKDFKLEKIKCYQQIDKKYKGWKGYKHRIKKIEKLTKKYGKEKALLRYNYEKNKYLPDRFKPKLPALYTMKIKITKGGACTV